jgi:DNA-binding NarL/FixJ family response regulator
VPDEATVVAVDDDCLTVAVLGGPAFVRHLVLHVLDDAGLRATAVHPHVTVLIDATAACFSQARDLGAPIVVLAAEDPDPAAVVDAVARGADAVVHTDVHPARLVEVLGAVAAGGIVLDAAATRAVVEALRVSQAATVEVRIELTRRERQILESIDRGESVKQTSRVLDISSKTVENLQSRLFRKLGVRNRAQAVAVAHGLALLGSGDLIELEGARSPSAAAGGTPP